ncbi:hypothetical protein Hanom_Chr08g00684781 [Helianthus anomalus]
MYFARSASSQAIARVSRGFTGLLSTTFSPLGPTLSRPNLVGPPTSTVGPRFTPGLTGVDEPEAIGLRAAGVVAGTGVAALEGSWLAIGVISVPISLTHIDLTTDPVLSLDLHIDSSQLTCFVSIPVYCTMIPSPPSSSSQLGYSCFEPEPINLRSSAFELRGSLFE